MLSKMRLAPTDRAAIIERVQRVLNHAPLKRLGLRKFDPGGA